MKKVFFAVFLIFITLASCVKEEFEAYNQTSYSQTIFKLYNADYQNEYLRSSVIETGKYDRLEYYIVDNQGKMIPNIKSRYIPETSEIVANGLHEGKYRLLVLGIKGDYISDNVEINKLNSAADCWLKFPETITEELKAEYFYSDTPFSVTLQTGPDGTQEVASLTQKVIQKRIVGKINFTTDYGNPYVRTAVTEVSLQMNNAEFYSSFSGNGELSGVTVGQFPLRAINKDVQSIVFLPSKNPVEGKIYMTTRSYKGGEIKQQYTFESQERVTSNHINTVRTQVQHPDDKLGTLFVTGLAYDESNPSKILQDDENKSIYADKKQREFHTSQPLQYKVTSEGQLHLRLYSPRGLEDVTVKARIPSIDNNYFTLAYFDKVEGFGDIFLDLPLFEREGMYETENGKQLLLGPLDKGIINSIELKVESGCELWQKFQQIKYGWRVYFGLYGGDPDQPDGKPNGNWMGIRPVHCREVVAFMLNTTYMISQQSFVDFQKQVMEGKPDDYYDNNKRPVVAETILEQLRYNRTLKAGLIYTGNGLAGLGGGEAWGVAQYVYFGHYTGSAYLAYHEIGHVMGYGHSSSFTYGNWVHHVMNQYYLDHLKEFPIDSPNYLNSSQNPNRYK